MGTSVKISKNESTINVGKKCIIKPLEGMEGRIIDVAVHPMVQYSVRYFNNGDPVYVVLFEDEVIVSETK